MQQVCEQYMYLYIRDVFVVFFFGLGYQPIEFKQLPAAQSLLLYINVNTFNFHLICTSCKYYFVQYMQYVCLLLKDCHAGKHDPGFSAIFRHKHCTIFFPTFVSFNLFCLLVQRLQCTDRVFVQVRFRRYRRVARRPVRSIQHQTSASGTFSLKGHGL